MNVDTLRTELKNTRGEKRQTLLKSFAEVLQAIQQERGFKVSARGWCYELEDYGLRKGDFDYMEGLVNDCRKDGILSIDFVAEEEGRQFSGIEIPEDETPIEWLKGYLDAVLNCEDWYTPDWWDGEEFYIQMVVEKIDLKTLFEPVCKQYHIPIATSKGWSSMLMRAQYAKRFQDAENIGLQCILLYCGDHDPDGLRISDFLRSNLCDLADIWWDDGTEGYDPSDLEITRFGLNYDFIEANNLSWIENLETGSKGEIARMVGGKIVQGRTKAGRPHPNFNMSYVQEYLRLYGVRKCEANAIVKRPKQGRALCKQTIEGILGEDAIERFQARWQAIADEIQDFRDRTDLQTFIEEKIEMVDKELESES